MLKKIKTFFKWIADHTGISWILGKLGWQSTNQEEDFVMVDKQPTKKQIQERKPELDVISEKEYVHQKSKGYLHFLPELVDGKIKLVTSTEGYEELQGKFKNKRGDGTIIDNEFRVNLDDKQLYITGSYDSKTAIENGDICLSINSVGTLDGKKVYGDNERATKFEQ